MLRGVQIRRLHLHHIDAGPEPRDVVVVIDVLRSFSTAAYALAAGARRIRIAETVAAARQLKALFPAALTTGALPGGDPVPGFDFGNSPSAFAGRDLAGHELIQCTAAGVRGLAKHRHARALFAGSLVCAQATAAAIAASAPQEVACVLTGEWVDRDGDEDAACADYLAALLGGERPDPTPFAQRVRNSDFGRRFAAGDNPSLPPADLDLCARADVFPFALQATADEHSLILTPVASAD